MQYQHTQRAPLYLALLAVAVLLAVLAWLCRYEIPPVVLGAAAGAFTLLGLCFRQLTVQDGGDALRVRFGPLPLFGTRIPYDSITGVAAGQSSIIDGWGIHYIPGRGWTFNLWGYDCVTLQRGAKVTRIGTDDAANLLNFLETKIQGRT